MLHALSSESPAVASYYVESAEAPARPSCPRGTSPRPVVPRPRPVPGRRLGDHQERPVLHQQRDLGTLHEPVAPPVLPVRIEPKLGHVHSLRERVRATPSFASRSM